LIRGGILAFLLAITHTESLLGYRLPN